uniref:F-box associated domain-containing protein n=1 Tax=Oryza punctata TaxID=4537 RepID=A0A0E0KJR9_ORYPU
MAHVKEALVLKMSCQKLSRQSLHLALNEGRGLYSLRHMDVSKLFYPSTAEALEAEAKANMKKKKKNGANKIGSMGRLPTPSIHYQPHGSTASNPYNFTNVFALFGENKNKILFSDMEGHSSTYNTELRSLSAWPELNFRKGSNSVAVSIPGASAHAMSNFDIDTDHSQYIMDINPANWCCLEVLAYDPVEECWCWGSLPQPPFFQDREYKPFFTVVDNTKICVSTTAATYSFDKVTREWNKVGDCSAALHSRVQRLTSGSIPSLVID